MHASLNSSLARIRRVDGAVIGAGFLVGERQILTCAHVITQALGMADHAIILPQSDIFLDFPLIAPKRLLRAHVTLWQPVQADGGGDIAGLELQSDPPEGIQAAFLALADDLWEHPFRAFGFPPGQDDGVWTTGRLLDKQATNWVMIEDVKEQGFPVARGFSGTPIWDAQLQGVVGIVVAAEGRAEIKAAYAIPVDVLLAAWPMLEARLLPRVFISSAPADTAFAARLKTDLQNRGIVATAPDRERAVHQAIRYANAVLLVASPHTRSSRVVKEHLQIAKMYQRHVVFLWVAGDELIQALPLVESRSALIDARQSRYETALDEITHSLDKEMLTPTQVLSLLELEGEPRNPYKGLRAFTQKDAGDFFGRDALLHDLVEAVKEVTTETAGIPAARLLTIIGPSGSGKSSVTMAGLLPRLQQGTLPGSETWIYLEPIVPGKRPVEALLLTLAPKFPDRSLKTIRDDLEDDSARGLHLLAVQMMKQPGGRVVLLIDQFEELFTQTISEEERQCFIDLLMTALTEPRGPVIVLLTLRADFYDRPMKYHELSALMVAHQQHVPPMKMEDLRTIIEQPAALPDVRLTFEGNLVGDLLFEVQGEIGALPLLQFTLDQLFEQRSGHRLTLQAYHSIGGVRGALTKQAESAYAGLPSDEHRELARSLFLRLIDPGTSVQDTTRRRASLEELTLPDPHQTATLRAVTDAFISARLLTTNTVAGTTTVEVSHEALIREWIRLTTWLSEAREDLHIQKQVSEDAVEWLRSGRPVDRLYRGTQLAQAQAWAERNKPSIDEVTFLQESTAERERQERAEYAQQERELDLQRRAARRQRYVIGMMAVTSVVLIAGLIVALVLYGQLQVQSNDLQIANQHLRASLPVSVTNLNDDGRGSLRDAIRIARPNSVITFAKGLNGTITLTSGELEITKNVTINGPGASSLSISGGNTSRVFHIDKGAEVIIYNVSIKNGHVYTLEPGGGGILNEGLLVLINCAISNSVAENEPGGGIYNSFGSLTLINSTASGNIGVMGGGIYNAYGTLTLTNSTISGNKADNTLLGNSTSNTSVGKTDSIVSETAILISPLDSNRASSYKPSSHVKVPLSGIGFAGGGIFNDGTLTLTNTTVSRNEANDGSGITNEGTAIITQSTISSNIVNAKGAPGAGIYNFGVLTLTNSTIADNWGQGDGGGIATRGSHTDLTFCTIYGNTTTGHGGGIFVGVDFISNKLAQVSMRNSIVAGNHAHDGSDISGPLTSYGYNLIQDVSGATIQTASNGIYGMSPDITGLSPDVGPLQDNGGPTQTIALQSGSPAINQIQSQNCFVNGVFTDQRGIQRPDSANSTNCDIGAYQTTSS